MRRLTANGYKKPTPRAGRLFPPMRHRMDFCSMCSITISPAPPIRPDLGVPRGRLHGVRNSVIAKILPQVSSRCSFSFPNQWNCDNSDNGEPQAKRSLVRTDAFADKKPNENGSFPSQARAREGKPVWKSLCNEIRRSADMSDIRRKCCKYCCNSSRTSSVKSS